MTLSDLEYKSIAEAGNLLQKVCHDASSNAGWWTNLQTGAKIDVNTENLVPAKLMLIVSEVAEAMEGFRKDLYDDKLKHRKMLEVELADAMIRICDLAGALNFNIGAAIAEKMQYNATREDHKIENRKEKNGKKF